MDPSEWMKHFRVVHQKAKAKQLSDSDLKSYLQMREELARSLVTVQSLQVPSGENSRKHFRVAQMLQVEVNKLYKAFTKEVSRAGFSCVLPVEMKVGTKATFALALSREGEPVTGEAKVVNSTRVGQWRTDFAIESMSDDNHERLEMALFDAVLARF